MKKILIVYGTRPEAIKLATLTELLQKNYSVSILNTQQHSTKDLVFRQLDNTDLFDASFLLNQESLALRQTEIMRRIEAELAVTVFDFVLVQGDTVSAYCGALLAFYRHIPVIYIESGLRTYSLQTPFPEEFYRQSISRIATYHFAPNNTAKENLEKEGIKDNVWVVGNIVNDEILKYVPELNSVTEIKKEIIITIHRKENIKQYFLKIIQSISELADLFPEITFKWITHPAVDFSSHLTPKQNIQFLSPQSHKDFLYLLRQAICVITDSGGIQEESVRLKTPALVMRQITERTEELSQGNYHIDISKPDTSGRIFDIINHLNKSEKKPTLSVDLVSVSEQIAAIITKQCE